MSEEIEKMAHSSGSCDHPDRHCLERYGDCRECSVYGICERLATQGYGDKKQAVKEFVSWVKDCIHGCKTISDFADSCLCGDIDDHFKELYGEE